MTSVELKNLLQDLAAGSAERVELDGDQLIPRIRTRRRRRGALTAVVAASAVVVVAAGAYAVRPGGEIDRPPVAVSPSAKPAPAPRFSDLCGKPFTEQLPPGSPLQLTVASKQVFRSIEQPLGTVPTLLTNTSDELLNVSSAPAAWGILVKDGVVVGVTPGMRQPAPQVALAPGKSEGFDATIGLVDCRTIKEGGDLSTGRALELGSYQLYVQLEVAFRSPSDPAPETPGGQWTTVESGPWPIEVK